jgi:ATP-dependent DNA helicase DinG
LKGLDAALGAVPGSQERPGQRAMVEAVATALGSGEHLLVQAGTGTGKSLGYLVPALMSGKRVVVATATKALQAQLVDKDLPRLVTALSGCSGAPRRTPWPRARQLRLPAAGARRARGARGRAVGQPVRRAGVVPGHPGGPAAGVGRVDRDGDRDEVPFPVTDRAWRQVSVSARECLGAKCPDRVDCFSEQAREAAKEADVVVANHTLLALDVFTGVSVLPERDAWSGRGARVRRVGDRRAVARAGPGRRATGRRAVTDLVSEATLLRLEAARDGLEGVLQLVEPGWVRALDRHSLDVLGTLETAAAAASAEITRELASSELAGEDVELARLERARSSWQALAEAAREIGTPSVASAVYAVRTGRAPAAGLAAARRRRAGQPAVRRTPPWWRPRRPCRSAGPSGTPRASSG